MSLSSMKHIERMRENEAVARIQARVDGVGDGYKEEATTSGSACTIRCKTIG